MTVGIPDDQEFARRELDHACIGTIPLMGIEFQPVAEVLPRVLRQITDDLLAAEVSA